MRIKYLQLLLFVIGLFSCHNDKSKNSDSNNDSCAFSINKIKNILYKKSLKKAQIFKGCYAISDTLFQDMDAIEDDGNSTWKGLNFTRNHRNIFMAETNWESDSIISRISFYSDQLETENHLKVGMEYRQVKDKTKANIETDLGFIVLKSLNDSNIHLILDPGIDDPSFDLTKNTIPDSLKVISIVVVDN